MRSVFIVGLSLAMVWGAAGQRPVRFSHEVSVLDLTNCLAQPGAVPAPIKPGDINLEIVDWTSGPKPEPFVGEFTLRLKAATLVGAIFVYGADNVQYESGGRWKQIEPGPEQNRQLQILPVPPTDLTQTVRVHVPAQAQQQGGETVYRAVLPYLTIIPLRTLNVAVDATVSVSSVEPGGAAAQVLVDGVVAKDRNFATAPREADTSAASPEWILLSWREPQSIRALGLWRGAEEHGLGQSITEIYKGEGDPALAVGQAEGWEEMKGRATIPGAFRSHQLMVSPSSLETRGVRIRSIGSVRQLKLGELVVLSDLGYAPGPVSARVLDQPAQETGADSSVQKAVK